VAFFLGIDGGGSKTECVLADEAGAVSARATGPGSNLRRASAEDLQQHLRETLEALRGKAHLERLRPEVVCGGFAGAGDAKARAMATEVLKELLQPRFLYVVGDMEVALEAAVGAGRGGGLLAGTRSRFSRREAGRGAAGSQDEKGVAARAPGGYGLRGRALGSHCGGRGAARRRAGAPNSPR